MIPILIQAIRIFLPYIKSLINIQVENSFHAKKAGITIHLLGFELIIRRR